MNAQVIVHRGGGDVANNILIIHDAAVGDFINMSAAIRELRRLYPDAYIAMMVTPMAMNFADACPYVDEVMENPAPWRDVVTTYRVNVEHAKYLLSRRFDAVYAFAHFPSTILLAYMSGARERISFNFNADDSAKLETGPVHTMMPLLTIKVPMRLCGTHNIDKNLGLLDYTLHMPLTNRESEIWFTPSELHNARMTLKKNTADGDKIYALCMGGSRASKKWSAENYAALCRMIIERESNVKFVILGSGKADAFYAKVFKLHLGIDGYVLDLTDQNSFQRSAALLSLCDMYIGNDTSAMHMAAAVKTPVLTPHYFAADLKMDAHTTPRGDYPYHVPSVFVLPQHSLPECQGSRTHYGCKVIHRPHCIMQVEPTKVFAAYNLLKQRIEKKAIDPLFMV